MKKNWREVGKLSKFDYCTGKRLLIISCLAFIGIIFFVISIVIPFCSPINVKISQIFNFIALAIMLIALSIFFFPKSAKEHFSEIAGFTVVEMKCWNVENSIERSGMAIIIKKRILVTNAKNILDDEGNVFKEIACYFLAKDCISRTRRKVAVIKYDKDLDIAVLGIIPDYRFPRENYEAIKYRSVVTLKGAEEIYVIKNSNENGEVMRRGMVLFPLVEKEYQNRKDFFIQLNLPNISENCGGAIIDKRGRFVGMLIYDEDKTPDFQYAIPAERLIQYLEY